MKNEIPFVIDQEKLPCITLIKNLKFDNHEMGCGAIASGEVLKTADFISEVTPFIPIPNKITSETQLKRLIYREEIVSGFDEDCTLEMIDEFDIEEVFPEYNKDLNVTSQVMNLFDEDPYYYNTSLNQFYSENTVRDEDIFNESYVICFLISADVEKNIAFIIKVIEYYFSKGMEARKIYYKIIDNYIEILIEGEIKEEIDGQEMFEKFHEFLQGYFKNLGFDFELD
jgi:hypothetical protein